MTKYSGTIIGIQPYNSNSIYSIVLDDKADVWNATLIVNYDEFIIKMTFNWNSESYDVTLKKVKENYYSGDIIYNRNEFGGKAYFWLYKSGDNLLLKGGWDEIDSGNYDCIVDLHPII